MEAGVGFEPTNGGFANRSVKPLHHPAFFLLSNGPPAFWQPHRGLTFHHLPSYGIDRRSGFAHKPPTCSGVAQR